MLVYRLIMWKRRWFGMAPTPRYIVENINDEEVDRHGNYPPSWLVDCPTAHVIDSTYSYMREQRRFIWKIT